MRAQAPAPPPCTRAAAAPTNPARPFTHSARPPTHSARPPPARAQVSTGHAEVDENRAQRALQQRGLGGLPHCKRFRVFVFLCKLQCAAKVRGALTTL